MKKIIDGRLYDSESESNILVAIIESNWKEPQLFGPPQPMFKTINLYKTENGNFFFEVCSSVGKEIPCKEEIYQLSSQSAMRWCVDNQDQFVEDVDFSIFDGAFPKA